MNAKVAQTVIARAQGSCECCGRPFVGDEGPLRLTIDHMQGRARSETVETCWALRARCHEEKTANNPSASYWLAKFAIHAKLNHYDEEHDWALNEILWRTAKTKTG